MMRRVINTGFWAGILASLAAIYPSVSLVAPLAVKSLIRPIGNELWHGVALMVSAALVSVTLLSFGFIAARRGGANSGVDGAKMGGLAGALVGAITFLMISSPLVALSAYAEISSYQPSLETLFPPEEAVTSYLSIMTDAPTAALLGGILINMLLGAVGGAIFGRRNGGQAAGVLPLNDHIAAGEQPRAWLSNSSRATTIAVFVGLAFGFIGMFMELSVFTKLTRFITQIPAMLEADSMAYPQFSVTFYLPIFAFPFLGAFVVYLIRNPESRWLARIRATVLASNLLLLPISLMSLRYVFLFLGLLPFIVFNSLSPEDQSNGGVNFNSSIFLESESVSQEVTIEEIETISTGMNNFLASQAIQETFFGSTAFILPWILAIFFVLFSSLVGLGQGAFYAWLMPFFRPSPVDVAGRLRRKIRRKPERVLPLIYEVFPQNDLAYETLVHLAIDTHKRMPAVSQLAGALHTLGTEDETAVQARAAKTVREILQENPTWQWSTDIGNVYHALTNVMKARTMEDILAIPPVDEHTTTSLPAVVVMGVQLMNRIMDELHKIEKVENLQTKTIFLENSLQAIHAAQKSLMATDEADAAQIRAPEHNALMGALAYWQELVVKLIQRLKGRAAITSELKNPSCTLSAQIPLVYEIANRGLNVAQHVRLRVRDGEGYHLVKHNGRADVEIDILPPGEVREVNLPIAPINGARRLRIEWDITYDDAIDAECRLEFADVLEFVDPERPFERIFPIPYVTGTPLKSDDVFVGRDDVFAFIRENLLGTHQNNAVILHGQRRTGKTSVLYRLGRVMTETHYAVLIDMQGKPARGEAEFLYSIADDIVFTLEEHDIFVEMPEREDFEDAPEFFFRNRFLRHLYKELDDDKNILLLFDEFEELQQRVQDGRLSPEIFTFLRNLMQHENRLDFVFSGTHKLEQLGAEYWSVLFNIAVYKPITFLSPSEVRRLILEPVADKSIEYDSLAIKRMASVTAGHPYFTQLVLHEMIVYYNETERTYITVTDVDDVLERIVERGEAHFKYIWAESSEEEQILLRAITERLVGQEMANIKDVQAFLTERGYEWGEAWEAALKSLLSRDILTHSSAKSKLYRFNVDLIRRWIDHTRPLL